MADVRRSLAWEDLGFVRNEASGLWTEKAVVASGRGSTPTWESLGYFMDRETGSWAETSEDERELALATALDEYGMEEEVAARGWDPSRHPRGPDGRFRSIVDHVKDKLDTHFSGGGGDPFDGYGRESLRRVAKRRGIALEPGESRESIAAKLIEHIRPTHRQPPAKPTADSSYSQPTSTPTRMTKGQYTKLLKDEHVRLQMLDGKSEKDARALARPAASIDDLKARNAGLRTKLRASGTDYRTDEQKRTDDAEKGNLLDEVQRLATEGGYNGPAKRAAASRMTVPELRKFIADTKAYQQRQAEKARAAREGAAAQRDFERRQATLTATPRQVDYILNLIARRTRSGEGGGFFVGPTDRAGIARLSQADASAYINSLTGNY